MTKRRFEILLPARYNDGRPIVSECMECFSKTLMEVADRFGALSYNPHSILGVWTQAGRRYQDELFRLTIDVDDDDENVEFIARLKSGLLRRFEQLEIYVVSYVIVVH